MASKMVIDRKKKARALEAAAREHARSVGEAFQSLLPESVREGVGGQNLSALVETLGDRFAELSDGLVEVDESGVVRLEDDRMARRERTLAVVALRRQLAGVRSVVSGALGGQSRLAELSLGGRIGRDPELVLRRARRVILRIEEGALDEVVSGIRGVEVDPAGIVEQLRGPVNELEQALETVSALRRIVQGAIGRKGLSLEEFDVVYLRTARLLEAIFAYSGRADLARQVRRSRHRSAEAAPEAVAIHADSLPAPEAAV